MLPTVLFSSVTPDCGLDSGSTTCSVLLTTLNNVGSTTLFNPVFNNLQQLVIFTRVEKRPFKTVLCRISSGLTTALKVRYSRLEDGF